MAKILRSTGKVDASKPSEKVFEFEYTQYDTLSEAAEAKGADWVLNTVNSQIMTNARNAGARLLTEVKKKEAMENASILQKLLTLEDPKQIAATLERLRKGQKV